MAGFQGEHHRWDCRAWVYQDKTAEILMIYAMYDMCDLIFVWYVI